MDAVDLSGDAQDDLGFGVAVGQVQDEGEERGGLARAAGPLGDDD